MHFDPRLIQGLQKKAIVIRVRLLTKGFFFTFQTNDLHAVHRGIKFSCHFTYNEIQTRWQALLYKPVISKLALQAIKNLHPEVVLSIQRKTLLSAQEREILSTIKSTQVGGCVYLCNTGKFC